MSKSSVQSNRHPVEQEIVEWLRSVNGVDRVGHYTLPSEKGGVVFVGSKYLTLYVHCITPFTDLFVKEEVRLHCEIKYINILMVEDRQWIEEPEVVKSQILSKLELQPAEDLPESSETPREPL